MNHQNPGVYVLQSHGGRVPLVASLQELRGRWFTSNLYDSTINAIETLFCRRLRINSLQVLV